MITRKTSFDLFSLSLSLIESFVILSRSFSLSLSLGRIVEDGDYQEELDGLRGPQKKETSFDPFKQTQSFLLR